MGRQALQSPSPQASQSTVVQGPRQPHDRISRAFENAFGDIGVTSPLGVELRGLAKRIEAMPHVAAKADDDQWRRHMDYVRTGLSGTVACMPHDAKDGASTPASGSPINSSWPCRQSRAQVP